MAARKLQQDIDKTVKKVQEGIELFQETFDKIQNCTQPTIKDKLEQDLKKEIKKLQRFRDQIKIWMQSNEIKDKTLLVDNRKLIETQMERFKALEKELKTKTFSQAGLNQLQKIDPLEEKKEQLREWLQVMNDQLTTQIDKLEAEQEHLNLKKKGKNKQQTRTLEIREKIERHKYHQLKLESILRMIDNGKLDVDQVEMVKEDVEDYCNRNEDDDFEENEYMYEDLHLEEAEIFAIGIAHEEDHSNDSIAEDVKEEIKVVEKKKEEKVVVLPPLKKKKEIKPIEKKPPIQLQPTKLQGPVPIDPPLPPATLRYASAAAGSSTAKDEVEKIQEQLQQVVITKKKEETRDLPPLEKELSQLFATPELLDSFKQLQNSFFVNRYQ